MRGFGLRDKVVVITGNGGALGSAFARGFADHGASLAILDFDLDNERQSESSKRKIGWIRGSLGGLKRYASKIQSK